MGYRAAFLEISISSEIESEWANKLVPCCTIIMRNFLHVQTWKVAVVQSFCIYLKGGMGLILQLFCLVFSIGNKNNNFSTTDRIEHCNLSPLCFLQNLLLFFHGKATLTNQLSEHPYIKPFFVVSSRIFICVRISTANVFPNSLNTSVTSKASYDSNCCFIRLQL